MEQADESQYRVQEHSPDPSYPLLALPAPKLHLNLQASAFIYGSGWLLTDQQFQTPLECLDSSAHGYLTDCGIRFQSGQSQFSLGLQCAEHSLFNGILRDQQIDLNRALLSHPVHPAYTLLKHRRVPGQVHVDHSICSLKVQPGGSGVRSEKQLRRCTSC